MRIEDAARAKGVTVQWKPFLLGPIFNSQGWNDSPFNIYPAKGAYMWRDMERQCAAYGLAFSKPDIFPVHSVTAARLAWLGSQADWCPAFSCKVYHAQFAAGLDISDEGVLGNILNDLNLPADDLLAQTQAPETKSGLREQTEAAAANSIFGAPSFLVGTELFWGDDRLDAALEFARTA